MVFLSGRLRKLSKQTADFRYRKDICQIPTCGGQYGLSQDCSVYQLIGGTESREVCHSVIYRAIPRR